MASSTDIQEGDLLHTDVTERKNQEMIHAEKISQSNNEESRDEKLSPSLYVIFLILVVDLLGFTVILPLLPSIFDHYDSNKKDHLYHWMEGNVRSFQYLVGASDSFNKVLFSGVLGSVFCALQFLVAPIFGSISDVYGRKPVLLISVIGIGISHAVWCFSNCFYIFIISRIIGGLSRANISLSTAIVTDLCSEKTRGKGMAIIGIAFGIGFIVGPSIGAVFASQTAKYNQNFYVLPAVFALSMSVLDAFLIIKFFKESLPIEKRASSIGQGLSEAYQFINPSSLFSFNPVIGIRSEEKRILKRIGLIYFIFLFIYSGLEYSLSFLTHTRFNFSRMQQGYMYLWTGIIMIFVQGGYVRKIPPGKEIKSASMGALVIIPSFIIIGVSSSKFMLYTGLSMYAFASATVVPCLTTLASKFGSTSQKGTVLGVFRSLGSLARALGPLVSAIAYWSLTPTVSYCFGGFLLVIPLYLIWKLPKLLPRTTEFEEQVVKED